MMKQKRQDLDYANYCIEQWAMWRLVDDGFSDQSPIALFSEVKGSMVGTILPKGVETPNREVDKALIVFSKMTDSSNKSAKRAHLLKYINLNIQANESIQGAIDRLEMPVRKGRYYDALEEFANRLDMVDI